MRKEIRGAFAITGLVLGLFSLGVLACLIIFFYPIPSNLFSTIISLSLYASGLLSLGITILFAKVDYISLLLAGILLIGSIIFWTIIPELWWCLISAVVYTVIATGTLWWNLKKG